MVSKYIRSKRKVKDIMKKRVYLMTAISAVALALTACGGNAGGNKSTNITSSTGSKTQASKTETASKLNTADYIETLGEYKGLEYTKTDTEVTEQEIEERVKSFLKNFPEKITNRAVQKGDTANIDFEGKKDGVAFDGGTAKGFELGIGSNSFIEGFEDGLIGKKPGETAVLNLKFPDDYKNSEELKGAKVVFTVKINYIVGESPTELTDELVKTNTEFKTATEYKADVKKKLEEHKKDDADKSASRELIEKVVTTSAIKSVPKDVEDRYYTQIMDYWNNVATQFRAELKDFIQSQFKLSEEEFNAEIRAEAINAAKQLIVIRAIAEAENIKVSDEEYKEGLNTYYENTGAKGSMELSAFEENFGKDRIMELVLAEKVGKFLMENGKEVK